LLMYAEIGLVGWGGVGELFVKSYKLY